MFVPLGCTTLTSPARHYALDHQDKVYWFDYASERRGAFLIPRGTVSNSQQSSFSVCAEPVPDVALAHSTELIGSAKLPETVDAELKAKFASEVVQLAGRTQTILFLRESMYRLCEQGVNGNLTPEEVRDLYVEVINAAVAFAKASAANEASRAIESATDPKTRKVIEDFLKKEN
jgi:hypothetical protein